MEASLLSNNRRYTVPSSSFVDPAIVTFIEKVKTLPNQQPLDHYEDDENTTTTSMASSPIITQRLSPPQPTASTSLDHLWSKQERFDNLELRLFALEESERRFEDRLQLIEEENRSRVLAMKPDQQPTREINMHKLETHDENNNYMKLYHSLLEKYSTLQKELEAKEKFYNQKINELTSQLPKKNMPKNEQKPCYKEEDGYLVFDSTNMNGEIASCRVKIPTPCKQTQPQQQQKPTPSSFYHASMAPAPPTRFTRIRPQQFIPRHVTSPKKTLNPNAPEWNKKDRRMIYYH